MTKKNLTRSQLADLWTRITGYRFSEIANSNLYETLKEYFGATDTHKRAFADKLCKKHGWKSDYAARAIEEYLRFTFLGVVSDFQVTPSLTVDEVWHQHQLFTASYRTFCNEVLQTNFDHRPGLIDVEESGFTNNYSKTYEAYRRHFNQEPPADIWPKPKVEVHEKFELVNTKENYRERAQTYNNNSTGDDSWLWWIVYSDTNHAPHVTTHETFDGFGGGSTGGGGAGGSFDSDESGSESVNASVHESTHSYHTDTVTTHSDHSDSGHSDSGSSHSSCSSSSCSSSCGGGGD